MITEECKHQRNYLHEHFNSIKQNKQMQTWSDETWFYIKALWKDDVHNLTIYRFMHCYRNVTCSEVIGELQPHQHRTWSSHQGSADSPALICVQSSCAGHEASQWFESTEGRYMASLLVRILSCGSCCGWRGHCVTCTVCHTQSICSVESWVLRWLHSPILELHTFSQCGQNTFGEDFVLRVLLWLKRPMRDRHRLPHTPRMCSVESWILRWSFTVQSWSCIPSHSVDRTLLVRTLSCGSCCGWRGQCVTGTVCHKPSMQTVMIININVLLVYWTRLYIELL